MNSTTKKSSSSSATPEVEPKSCSLCGYRYASPDWPWLSDTKGRRFCSMTCLDKQSLVERSIRHARQSRYAAPVVESAIFTAGDGERYSYRKSGQWPPK